MSKTIRRIYPIRKTRKNWFIRLFAHHDCNLHLSNEQNTCSKKNEIEDTIINLSEYDIKNPMGINGKLINENEVVIPDNKINISFDFPLINLVSVTVNSREKNGFKLKDIIQIVKDSYKSIYEEEAKTAPEKTYELEKLCYNCIFEKDLLKYVKIIDKKDEDKECPICYNDYEDESQLGEINCGHKFHLNCIKQWVDFDGKNCPMCRKLIKECKDCNGSLIIHYNYTGTVIPIDQRGIVLNRNITYGKYGIYCYDFEDLFLNGFWYDKKNKTLKIFIDS